MEGHRQGQWQGWCKGKDFHGKWLPCSREITSLFLGNDFLVPAKFTGNDFLVMERTWRGQIG